MDCSKLKQAGIRAWEEFVFWVEVLGEFCGWDRSPYHWVFEQHERDVEEAKRTAELLARREKFNKTS
jgi:hypothetical protein